MTDVPASVPDLAHPRKILRGPNYREFIREILAKKKARNYLEIGVRDGGTIMNAACPTIGVDPNFVLTGNPVGSKRVLHLYQMTSDEFFREHDPRAIFGEVVDVAFLDGLHLFEFLLRDFINTERVSGRNSSILLDDCLPVNIEMTEREHRPERRMDRDFADWWTGDVWKVVTVLRKYRPDLRITAADVQPTGCVVVSNLDPMSTVLNDRYFAILDEFADVTFSRECFESYWSENSLVSADRILHGFDYSLFLRA
jgi:hypothetical protein